MKRKILLLFVYSLAIIVFATAIWLSQVNDYQQDGEMNIPTLTAPVRVVRDDFAVPYVYAENLDDAIRAQGFLVAQDRLYQIEFVRYLSQGRLAELIGGPGVQADVLHRVVGLPRLGRQLAEVIDPEHRRILGLYLEGLNAYIEGYKKEHQLGLQIVGIEPQPWTIEDMTTLLYFTNWSSTANLNSELVAAAVIDQIGPEKADEISQVSINPDVGVPVYPLPATSNAPLVGARQGELQIGLEGLWGKGSGSIELGSNHWAVAPSRSASGAAIYAGNPHIDSRTLPGIWYPMGIITPELRVVGAAGPGAPGFAVARTDNVAFGVTNSYGDAVDLYIETVDPENPDNYLEGSRSIPFEIVDEVIRVRNRKSGLFVEQSLRIRFTKRGPVISDHGITLNDAHVMSLRWAATETVGDDKGLIPLILAQNVAEFEEAVAGVTSPYNYTAVDSDGSIAHFTAGRIPVRRRGDGSRPLRVASGYDTWKGIIPPQDMPRSVNPERGWLGNANHRTLPKNYPYRYSTHFAHVWRYERMLELLDPPGKTMPEDHWRYMLDVKNKMAQQIVPLMSKALSEDSETAWIAADLRAWDYMDDPEQRAPLLFQTVYRQFLRYTYNDDLGVALTGRLLDNQYYWQDRMAMLIRDNENPFFDDRNTFRRETRDDIFRKAAVSAMRELTSRIGEDRDSWTWGELHTVTFKSPIVPVDAAANLLGGGTHPKEGSGETLNRAKFKLSKPYRSTFIDSMRFVADMGDPDKVMGVVSGGVSGRQFDPHLKDQMELWLTGEPNYWWFSDAAIEEHAVSELLLLPDPEALTEQAVAD